jgi:hypothetical protein
VFNVAFIIIEKCSITAWLRDGVCKMTCGMQGRKKSCVHFLEVSCGNVLFLLFSTACGGVGKKLQNTPLESSFTREGASHKILDFFWVKSSVGDEWIKKMWYLYTMEFYAAMKKNEMLSFAGKWMELENIILSEVSLAQKTKNRMFSLICGH